MVDTPGDGLGVGHCELLEGPPHPSPHTALLIPGGMVGSSGQKRERSLRLGPLTEAIPLQTCAPEDPRLQTPCSTHRPSRSMLPAAMKSLGLALLALLLCPSPGESEGRGSRGERVMSRGAPSQLQPPRAFPTLEGILVHRASDTALGSLILRGPLGFLLSLGTHLSFQVLCAGVREWGRQDVQVQRQGQPRDHLGPVGMVVP